MTAGTGGDLRFAILGPLEVRAGDTRIRLGGPIASRVLTTLLLDSGRMVPVSRLVEAAWDEEPPATAAHQVRKAVAELRQRIPGGAALLVTDGPGYRADVSREQLDLSRFSDRLREARDALEAGRRADAADRLRAALALWRGPVMPGGGGSVIAAASVVLQERRLAAVEQLMELRLALGESRELVGDLRELVAEHPMAETFRGQLMLAPYAWADGLATLTVWGFQKRSCGGWVVGGRAARTAGCCRIVWRHLSRNGCCWSRTRARRPIRCRRGIGGSSCPMGEWRSTGCVRRISSSGAVSSTVSPARHNLCRICGRG
ncbi:DNA-binding SARP family transcriptional activator [Streptomyces sp. TE5632]